ncbi:MAG: hypothetical protein ACJ781_12725 [Myxococcales bacterium]
MRFALVVLCLLLPAFRALADDVRPPAISEVSASRKGRKIEVRAMITDETGVLSAICHHRDKGAAWETSAMRKDSAGDVFRASFNAGGETEYWIEATDLLGNGPASYGSVSTPIAAGGGKPEPGTNGAHGSQHRPLPPVVQHRKPPGDLPAGQEVTVRARIRADGPISSTALHVRDPGQNRDTILPMHRVEGDTYEATIPADRAHGTLEYRIAARDRHGLQTVQGEAKDKWFSVTFKPPAPAEPPFAFAVNPPRRIPPGSAISVRAQITGPASTEDVVVPDRARVLYRGPDGRDESVDMKPDPTGGLGGFKADLPGHASGPVYFQVLACDALESRCALDTGDKRKWHAVSIAKTPGPPPPALDSPSTKLPSTMQ